MESEKKTGGKTGNEELVFHYSRERRLERAPERVRSLYEDRPSRTRNFLAVFRANPSGVWVLLSVILIAVFMFIFSTINRRSGKNDVAGNTVTLSAVRFPDATYLLIKKKAAGSDFYSGPVSVAVSVPRADGAEEIPEIATYGISFSQESEEEFPLALPFSARELLVVIQAGDVRKMFRFRP